MPLGAYIRWRLLNADSLPPRHRGKLPVKDHAAIARILGLLGQSRISSNLNQLAKAAHIGALPLDDELAHDLGESVQQVAEIRALVFQALGLSDDAS